APHLRHDPNRGLIFGTEFDRIKELSFNSERDNSSSLSKSPTKDPPVIKRLFLATLLSATTVVAFFFPCISSAQGQKAVYFWISHGSPTDPVWTLFLQGAEQWAKDTGNDVRTSFHSGDVPSHQEAFRAAITAHAKGIVTSTPDPGSLTKVTAEAHAAGIPVIILNTDDKASGRDASVAGDTVSAGRRLAQYLVDYNFVKKGDFVWTPVEVPGATYQTLQTQGYDSVFKPLGITTDITETKLDQAEVISRMSDYLTANRRRSRRSTVSA